MPIYIQRTYCDIWPRPQLHTLHSTQCTQSVRAWRYLQFFSPILPFSLRSLFFFLFLLLSFLHFLVPATDTDYLYDNFAHFLYLFGTISTMHNIASHSCFRCVCEWIQSMHMGNNVVLLVARARWNTTDRSILSAILPNAYSLIFHLCKNGERIARSDKCIRKCRFMMHLHSADYTVAHITITHTHKHCDQNCDILWKRIQHPTADRWKVTNGFLQIK